jgi:hypothetical protein
MNVSAPGEEPLGAKEMVRGAAAAGGGNDDGTAPGVVRRLTGRTLFGTATLGERNCSGPLGSSGFGTGGGNGTDSAAGSSLAEDFDFDPNNLLKEKAMAARGVNVLGWFITQESSAVSRQTSSSVVMPS